MRKQNSDFKTGFVSEAGTFIRNKDYFAYVELDDMACYVVADGMDSDEENESAEIAVSSIFNDFTENPTMSRRKLKKYIMNAHKLLNEESRNIRLKCSLIIVVTDYSKMVWAVAGNSRMYHFSKGRFNFSSKDQSIAQIMADAGKIRMDEVDRHDERNNLVNYIGKANGFKPFISNKYKLNDGDILLLCTSGVWGNVDKLDIVEMLKCSQEPQDFAELVEEFILSKQNKVINNYTLAAVYANKVFKENPQEKMQLFKKVSKIVVPVFLVVAIAMGTFMFIRNSKIVKIEKTKTDISTAEKNGNEDVKNGEFDKALSEYENAQKLSKSINSKSLEAEMQKKADITRKIINGNNYFDSNEYEKALSTFKIAKNSAIDDKEYDKTILDEKIKKADGYIKVINLEKEGTDELDKQNYAGAKRKFQEALSLANKLSFEDKKKDLKDEIKDADSQITDKDNQKNVSDAKNLESDGDMKCATQDYEGALNSYTEAQKLYKQGNEDTSGIDSKINDTKFKILSKNAGTQATPGANK